jgi:oligopeptide transport system permease protein
MTEPSGPEIIDRSVRPVARSPLVLGLRRFRANKAAVASGVVLVIIVVACFATYAVTWSLDIDDAVSQEEEATVEVNHPWSPSAAHPFGTDTNGRDVLLRALRGGAISLSVGFIAAAVSVFIGTFYGAISGQAGGRVDHWMMRVVDTLYGLPYILMVILILAFAGRQFWVVFLAIGCVSWLTMARIVRGEVLRLRETEYIQAARALGAGPLRILSAHILPNLAGPIIVCATLTVPVAILQETFLSFLGLGVSSPETSWGQLATDGVMAVSPIVTYWWLLVFPCLFLGATLLCLNFIGDGLRDAFDPKMVNPRR